MNGHGRLYALDNLRALMMWLGIVLHVSLIHTVTPNIFPFHDQHTSVVADLLLLFIHSFRMLVFFVLAGFFAAMLAERDGTRAMLRNRLRRIGLPFAVFWPLLLAATVLAIMLFVHVLKRGTLGIDPSLMERPAGGPALSTMHLWFLYYLMIFYVAAAAISALARQRQHAGPADLVARLGSAWWGCLLLAVPAALMGFEHPAGIVPNRTSFLPHYDELIHNGVFFAFGWLFYARRDALLAHYARRCWRYLGAGLLLFVVYLGVLGNHEGTAMPVGVKLWTAHAYACVGWLLGFGSIGLFSRFLHTPGPLLTYLARSSYWVYLLHFPLTIVVGALLYRFDVGAAIKMLVNVAAVTVLCLLSYHLLVRRSAIGRLLNGAPTAALPTPTASAPALP